MATPSPIATPLASSDASDSAHSEIIFGVIGSLIGLAGLVLTAITLRFMYLQRKRHGSPAGEP
ncbi:hypothetical protein BU26DRAFT_517434 [Trematosphaeria pertusa]|uniref:Uncharacterized protein n=1 Tax=Trematosphaeria pertusa TaxID=390896 RepID=A0A6A6IKK0_9PLEO|nr:uncharacterized protein BU26DRAFT_517434 [Trematosphaeria pertusa]KAF2250608.1 hypothetical protein BU26DRAFT_517434 [Trematosphaeria pertusa]